MRLFTKLWVVGAIMLFPFKLSADLKFEKTEILYKGTLGEENHTYVFSFKNAGDESITIDRVAATCNCAPPVLSKKTLKKGDVATLSIKIKFPSSGGDISRTAMVSASGKKTFLTMKAEIPEIFRISRRFFRFDTSKDLKGKEILFEGNSELTLVDLKEVGKSPLFPVKISEVTKGRKQSILFLPPKRMEDPEKRKCFDFEASFDNGLKRKIRIVGNFKRPTKGEDAIIQEYFK